MEADSNKIDGQETAKVGYTEADFTADEKTPVASSITVSGSKDEKQAKPPPQRPKVT